MYRVQWLAASFSKSTQIRSGIFVSQPLNPQRKIIVPQRNIIV